MFPTVSAENKKRNPSKIEKDSAQVAPSGIEPESRASETLILSVVLRSQFLAKLKNLPYERLLWSHLGLNQGPPDYESGALTS